MLNATFLTMMVASTYLVLRDSVALNAPTSKSLKELQKGHCKPTRLFIAERFQLSPQKSTPGKIMAQYMAVLRRLAKTSQFGQFLNNAFFSFFFEQRYIIFALTSLISKYWAIPLFNYAPLWMETN